MAVHHPKRSASPSRLYAKLEMSDDAVHHTYPAGSSLRNVGPPGAAQAYQPPPTPNNFAYSTTLRKAATPDLHEGHASHTPARGRFSLDAAPPHFHPSLNTVVTPSSRFCRYTPTETVTALSSSLTHGLPSRSVPAVREAAGGWNEFEVNAPESGWIKFGRQFVESPLILLLLGSALVSLVVGNTDDAVSITLAIVIVVTVGFVQEQRSEKSLEALNKLVPHYCHLIRDGRPLTVLANELVPGDLITFTIGDRIPADVRLIEAVSLEIDESTLTGETKPAKKGVDAVPYSGDGGHRRPYEENLSIQDKTCIAFMGTLVRNGHGRAIVISTGSSTELGVIFSMVDEVTERRTPLQLRMDELAKKLSAASFVIIGVICLLGVFQRREWLEMFTIGVSLAVAAIPEGLPIVVTVTLALGVLRMSKRNAIVKKLPSVETLGSVSVICSDKTGTLTKNEMTVTYIYTASATISASTSSTTEGELVDVEHKPIPHTPSRALLKTLQIGNLCNNSTRNEEGANVGQSTDVAMMEVLAKFGLEDARQDFQRSSEIPFNSEQKWMAVAGAPLNAPASSQTLYVKGALEAVLERSRTFLSADGNSTPPLDAAARTRILAKATELADKGLRIIGCAYGAGLHASALVSAPGAGTSGPLTFVGFEAMLDPPRRGVEAAVRSLSHGGVQVVMITGDAEHTALAIARQLGIATQAGTSSVMTGPQIDQLSQRQLQDRIAHVSVFARTTPRHKMAIISAFQARGSVVAMTGDGVNDAPALKMADIGISMGKSGTDVAKEAADVILVDDNLSTILPAVEEGKSIFYNIQNFLSFQLSTAVAALTLITLSTAFRLSLPLNPMQILFINILMDGPPSQSLGVDPVDRDVMRRPPRAKTAPVLNQRLLARVLFSASIIVIGTLYVYVSELADGEVTRRDQTMTFTSFVFLDLASALQNRGLNTPIMGNRMLVTTVAVSFLTQLGLVYVPWLQSIFQTEALAGKDLLLLFFLAGVSMTLHEVRRRWERAQADKERWEADVV